MRKYDQTYRNTIAQALSEGYGRIHSVKKAGVSYQTFINWLENDIEFFELIKKAEDVGSLTRKELAINSVIKAFDKSWQSGAWWLERKYPDEFAKRENNVITAKDLTELITIKTTNE